MKEVTKCPRCYAVYRYKHVCNGTLVHRLKAQLAAALGKATATACPTNEN